MECQSRKYGINSSGESQVVKMLFGDNENKKKAYISSTSVGLCGIVATLLIKKKLKGLNRKWLELNKPKYTPSPQAFKIPKSYLRDEKSHLNHIIGDSFYIEPSEVPDIFLEFRPGKWKKTLEQYSDRLKEAYPQVGTFYNPKSMDRADPWTRKDIITKVISPAYVVDGKVISKPFVETSPSIIEINDKIRKWRDAYSRDIYERYRDPITGKYIVKQVKS